MSFKRDMQRDRAKTRAVLAGGSPIDPDHPQLNWLGHRFSSATTRIDAMLLSGASIEELEATRGAVNEHLYHLRVEHGLPLTREPDGRWKFDRAALEDFGATADSHRAHVPTSALAKSAEVRDDMLWVTLMDGRVIAAPLVWFPILSSATPEQRSRYEILGGGVGLHWPDIDEDLSVAGLLAGAAASGS